MDCFKEWYNNRMWQVDPINDVFALNSVLAACRSIMILRIAALRGPLRQCVRRYSSAIPDLPLSGVRYRHRSVPLTF